MSTTDTIDSIDLALLSIREGRMAIVVDDFDRENEGDLIGAAQSATREMLAVVVRHGTGIVCVSIDAAGASALELRAMVPENADAFGTAFTVSVDVRKGTTTGVSASDRAATIRALASGVQVGGSVVAADFARPGHVFPLVARAGGVLVRGGHTEASLDLVRLAGRGDAAFLCEIVSEAPSGDMAALPELRTLARSLSLPLVSIADLQRHRARREVLVTPTGGACFAARHARATYAATVRGRGDAVVALLVLREGAINAEATVTVAIERAAIEGGALLLVTAMPGGVGSTSLDSNVERGEAHAAAVVVSSSSVAPPSATEALYSAPLGTLEACAVAAKTRGGSRQFCDRAVAEFTQVASAVLRALSGIEADVDIVVVGQAEEKGVGAAQQQKQRHSSLLMSPQPALPAAKEEGESEASLVARATPQWPRIELLLTQAGETPPLVWQYGLFVGKVETIVI
jgi:3,4-dihydroxy-2-butanone 4-phosphate synthase